MRVTDLGLARVDDPRVAGKVDYPLPTIITALLVSMTTMARSLRMVEQRTEQMALKQGEWMGVDERIADNTFGKVLPRLEVGELMACLHRLVKAEHFLLQLCTSNRWRPRPSTSSEPASASVFSGFLS